MFGKCKKCEQFSFKIKKEMICEDCMIEKRCIKCKSVVEHLIYKKYCKKCNIPKKRNKNKKLLSLYIENSEEEK